MLSLAEDTSGLVKASAIAMHPLLQKQNTLYKWFSSRKAIDKERFKESCQKVQKPLEMPRVFSQSQRNTGRSKPWRGGVEDQDIQRWRRGQVPVKIKSAKDEE